jgi:hypothetical protein
VLSPHCADHVADASGNCCVRRVIREHPSPSLFVSPQSYILPPRVSANLRMRTILGDQLYCYAELGKIAFVSDKNLFMGSPGLGVVMG